MKKIEFLATSLPSGLKVNICYFNGCADTKCVKLIGRDLDDDLNGDYKVIPIIRHPDTLTQECVQADYNNGEPFQPLTSLAHNFRDYEFCYYNEKKILGIKHKYFNDSFMFLSDFEKLNQLLLSWHFWLNMPEGEEVVYVTETFNPYK